MRKEHLCRCFIPKFLLWPQSELMLSLFFFFLNVVSRQIGWNGIPTLITLLIPLTKQVPSKYKYCSSQWYSVLFSDYMHHRYCCTVQCSNGKPLNSVMKLCIMYVCYLAVCYRGAKAYDKAVEMFDRAADAYYKNHAYPSWITIIML